EAEALLKAGHWVGKTNLWIVSGSDMVSKTRFFEDMRSELRDRHGYTLRDFIELLDMAGIIYDSGEVRFDMRPISRARQFVSDLADLVPKEQHRQLRSFVGLVCMGARNYVHSGAPQASQEWVHAIENYFSTYKRSPILFRDAVLALKELKFNSYGELERWPGVVHLTVEAAAYAAHRLVEQTEEEPDFTDGFARLLLGYRASPYIKAPRPGSEKISLSPLEEETYQYLSSVQRGARDGIKTQPKRMLIHDVDRLFEIYEKHTGRL
ncbi:TPA: hypothetical protein HA265_03320, partial [Candidatus Woesearchaeota archaeon]|nr:hypothetical protein [Candidatus Woesearchaeota archaeon]